MTASARLLRNLQRERGITPGPNAIHAVVLDGEHCLCLDEAQLDTWWANLPAAHKAELYEQDLEGELRDLAPAAIGAGDCLPEAIYGQCHYCACTDDHTCQAGCTWIDDTHALCSNPACIDQFNAEMASGALPLVQAVLEATDAAL